MILARIAQDAEVGRGIGLAQRLAELVRRCVPRPRGKRHAIDPATRVFQALRIAVNDELGALERLLKILPACLKPGGRATIIELAGFGHPRYKRVCAYRSAF